MGMRGCVMDVGMWKYLLTHSIPVGGATGLRLLSQQIDVFILTWMRDMRTVGLFSGPYRISMALRFIPQTMSLPLYPMYARMAHAPEGQRRAVAGGVCAEREVFFDPRAAGDDFVRGVLACGDRGDAGAEVPGGGGGDAMDGAGVPAVFHFGPDAISADGAG